MSHNIDRHDHSKHSSFVGIFKKLLISIDPCAKCDVSVSPENNSTAKIQKELSLLKNDVVDDDLGQESALQQIWWW